MASLHVSFSTFTLSPTSPVMKEGDFTPCDDKLELQFSQFNSTNFIKHPLSVRNYGKYKDIKYRLSALKKSGIWEKGGCGDRQTCGNSELKYNVLDVKPEGGKGLILGMEVLTIFKNF